MPKQEEPKIKYPEGRTKKEKEDEALKEEGGEGILKEENEREKAEVEVKDKDKLAEERAKIKGIPEVVKKELTPEEKEIEEAKEKIREMEKWRDLQIKGLLTEKAVDILKDLEKVISEIDQKYNMLTMAKKNAERFEIRIKKGEFDKGGFRNVPEGRLLNPIIDLEEREKEMKELEKKYNKLKEELRKLEEKNELEKKVEPEKEDEEKISGEETGITEEKKEEVKKGEKEKGLFWRLFEKK